MYTELGLFIDGKWLNGDGRKGEDVINPATGKTLAHSAACEHRRSRRRTGRRREGLRRVEGNLGL